MRIAIVTESFLPRTDGVVRSLLELLSFLRARDHEALVVAPGPGPLEHLGYRVARAAGLRFPLYPDLTLSPFCPGMTRLWRTWKPDIVHLASPFVLGACGCRAARRLGLPVAAHYQTDVAGYARHFHLGALSGVAAWRLTRLHNDCRVNYAPTESQRLGLIAQGVRNVRVLGRGVDSVLFNPVRRSAEVRRALLMPGEECLFLYVGRISSEKNIVSLAPMIAAVPRARLVVVGEGPKRSQLETHFRGLPATFLGARFGTELATLYASADIFSFPSLTETFGQVVQEAMASGLAVLAYRAGGVQDLFRHAVEGLLCPAGYGIAWIQMSREMAVDAALRERLGVNARQATLSRTWEAIFTCLLEDYELLAHAGTPGHAPVRRTTVGSARRGSFTVKGGVPGVHAHAGAYVDAVRR